MACGEAGGIYLRFGERLRTVLRDRGTAELEPVVTNGSAENLALLGDGSVDLAIALADTAEKPGSGELLALGRVYQNYLQCVVRADGDVRSLDDLAGRPVSIGATGSGSSWTTSRLLSATGRSTGSRAPRVSEHPLTEALDLLAAGAADAIFWSGGIPTPQIQELSERIPLALLDLAEGLPALTSRHPGPYLPARVPAGVYGAAAPTATIGIPNYLLAHRGLTTGTAGAVVDALVGDARRLVPEGSVGVQFLTQAALIDTGDVPLHPAARGRYRELYG